MKLNYKKSESTVKPELIDTESSKTTVYVRKDIVKKIITDEMMRAETVFYEYLEVKLTKAQYQQYLTEISMIDIEKQRADIDYIALMTGVDLEDD